ncbi:hypothetical protein GGH94_006215 [Coemansia aciculifera]|uniref:Conserved oligomeric Golgi complex subunit 1 n=1 Tax=Coemansia aciculifera TaxID=417176 RepID=A0A9W8ICB2_9FUNG|nr:hypothetical protein GGH94_006215 [Coemansia aciculifera]KAJ2869330.1 hypothetical protein GGH93_006191 [Coemansia aciculifera]
MSWLQRNIFSRNRSASQSTESEQQPLVIGDSTTSFHSQTQRLEETEKLLRQKYQQQQQEESPDLEISVNDPVDSQLLDIDSADGLFAKLSITEMRRYEQSLQKRIETMRGQMRKVAGRHYPELIDAADSAVAMDRSSAKISMRLSSLRAMLENAHHPKQLKPLVAEQDEGGAKTKVYAIAAQVKVLVDTPEQIWKALGAQRFLQAALLYMIAGEIHGRLRKQSRPMPEDQTAVDPLLAFPVIERQWESIAPFREQITAKSRLVLASSDKSFAVESGLSAICAIALLDDDVDAEMACTVFLAHRGESLTPLLDSLRVATGSAAELDDKLQELLGRVRQILTDYVAVFGIPDDYSSMPGDGVRAGGQYASWILTTLASICADCDLPISPSLRRALKPSSASAQPNGANEPSLVKRRSELQQGLRARGRRTSSIAGSVLSSSLVSTPVGDAHMAGNAPPTPWVSERGTVANGVARSGSAFIVGKYLPQEIAQFRPHFVRMLDVGMLLDGDVLNEADEDQVGLEYYLDDPPALLRVLATQVQPGLERIARHALGLWWAEVIAAIQDAAQSAIAKRVLAVSDAARVGASLVRWENEGVGWTRGFSWTTVASNPVLAGPIGLRSLYASVVEPLLQARARRLQCAAVDMALSLPESFLLDSVDVDAGHLPWRGVPDDSTMAELVEDVRGLDFVPPDVRALGDAVDGGLQASWRDGAEWWQQMNGAVALPEALVCARYFSDQWQALAQRLGAWASNTQATDAAESEGMPQHVAACIKGAWTASVLVEVAHRVLATDTALMRECWQQLGITGEVLTAGLQSTQRRLLVPWFEYLGRSMAVSWAAQFDSLYYQIPRALRRDAAATRRDVVQAWVASSASSARYSALRQVAVSTLSLKSGAVSPAVRCLAIGIKAQAQAVCGLGSVVESYSDMRGIVGQALADTMLGCVVDNADEWDAVQLSADIRFVCEYVGGQFNAYAPLVARIGSSEESRI